MPDSGCQNASPDNPPFGGYTKVAMAECPERAPDFLPQPGDEFPPDAEAADQQQSGPIGPWATGRVDWGPLAGLTGTRPVVDHYSITRFSEGEWRKRNQDLLCASAENQHRNNLAEFNSRRAMQCVAAAADKNQHENRIRVGARAHEVYRWKTEVERATELMCEELDMLEAQRRRSKQAKVALNIVKAISNECLERRSMRMEPDLVRDEVDEQLVREAALVKEVGDLMDRTLVQIEEQMTRNKATKARLEDDWSDKMVTYEIATRSVGLTNLSTTPLFYPGATRFLDGQSTPAGWEHNTRDVLSTAEAVRAQSCELRALLNGPILSDCIRDLKAQADRVDNAFIKKIGVTEQCRQALEHDLQTVVQRIGNNEKVIMDLRAAIRGLDRALKVAQTRLECRSERPRNESCRDEVQFGLVDEVKSIAEQASALQAQLCQSELSIDGLYKSRGDLERELQVKLKTLYLDKERCQVARCHYPSATAMAGH